MAEKRKPRRKKRRQKYEDPKTGEVLTYLEPDHRTVTVAHWRSSGMTAPDIAKQLNISEQTVYNELKVMEQAQKASSDPEALRSGLMALYPKAVRAISEDMDLEESGPLGLKFLTGVGALQPEMAIDNRYLNITGSEVITQLLDLVRGDAEFMRALRIAVQTEDSQAIQLSGPDNLPPAIQAERVRRAEERKKHALLTEGHTPETQAGLPDIQEGSTSPVESPNEPSSLDTFWSGPDVPRPFLPDSGTGQRVTEEGGFPSGELVSEFADSNSERLAALKLEVERLEAEQASKQVKRVELKIRPGEGD